MTPPDSLVSGELAPLWDALRDRLERQGSMSRGRLRTPTLSTKGRHQLNSLLGRPVGATIDLAELERALALVGVGPDLAGSLIPLGHPMSFEREQRRAERAVRREAREAARALVSEWPESWSVSWIDEVIQTGLLRGLDASGAIEVVTHARRCLDALADDGRPRSRVDLAAVVVGDSHALDAGTRLGAAVMRMLRQQHLLELHDDTDRNVWDRAGVPSDSVSAPVLTWNLPVVEDTVLSGLIATATSLGVVAHLSEMALRSYPLAFLPNSVVLVAENPRIVEAAAQRRSTLSVVSTNGNPSSAVRLLLTQLLTAGAHVRYHGDFDAPGLAICRRMFEFGLRPWGMQAQDYERAVADAAVRGVDLPIDPNDPGPTPWDEPLRDAFRQCGRVVHEERVIDDILGSS